MTETASEVIHDPDNGPPINHVRQININTLAGRSIQTAITGVLSPRGVARTLLSLEVRARRRGKTFLCIFMTFVDREQIEAWREKRRPGRFCEHPESVPRRGLSHPSPLSEARARRVASSVRPLYALPAYLLFLIQMISG